MSIGIKKSKARVTSAPESRNFFTFAPNSTVIMSASTASQQSTRVGDADADDDDDTSCHEVRHDCDTLQVERVIGKKNGTGTAEEVCAALRDAPAQGRACGGFSAMSLVDGDPHGFTMMHRLCMAHNFAAIAAVHAEFVVGHTLDLGIDGTSAGPRIGARTTIDASRVYTALQTRIRHGMTPLLSTVCFPPDVRTRSPEDQVMFWVGALSTLSTLTDLGVKLSTRATVTWSNGQGVGYHRGWTVLNVVERQHSSLAERVSTCGWSAADVVRVQSAMATVIGWMCDFDEFQFNR
jgi:hypothetical protein